ncbi:hypothetical protein [Escherichia phage phiA2-1]|nr:hypothetical protein [Escherichia phage phiA2-1]
MHPQRETAYTIYTMFTLSYGWLEMPKSVTSANAYTKLQRFTRKLKSTICKTNWTGYGAEYIVTSSKAINQRDI